MQPQNCSNGPSSLSSDDHMQQVHHRHPNQKSAIAATATTAASAGAASSASPLFPTSLRHHFQKMDQEGFDHAPPPHDDFIEQMLSSLNPASAWDMKNGCENDSALPGEESENGVSTGGFQFDESSKLRAQQMLPIRFDGMDDVVHHSGTLLEGSSYDSFHQQGVENQMAVLFNGSLVGSLLGSGQQMNHLPEHFQGSQGGPAFDQVSVAMNSNGHAPMDGAAEAAATQPKQRVRARRGQATDPHSIAERLRRERIAERMKGLQELVPNANKTDKASMLDEIIEYVKFLQLQVKVLSMSRLGGAGAVAPLVGDNMSSGGGGDSLKARAKAIMRRGGSNEEVTATSNTTEVNEKQVAKLLEEDMGSAMQYLQSKGLCLMPISLAAAISTARNPLSSSTKRAGTNSGPRDS